MPPQIPQPPQSSPLTPETQPQQPVIPIQPATAPQPPKKRFPLWLKIVAGVVFFFVVGIIVAIVVSFTATQEPQKVSDQFVNELQAGNTGALYALTSPAFKETITEDELDVQIQRVSPALQGEEEVTGRGNRKVYTVLKWLTNKRDTSV
jgi:hypothetical protein